MVEQKKKMRLEDIKVESFVTSSSNNPATLLGGAYYTAMVFPVTGCPCEKTVGDGDQSLNVAPGALCCSDACTGGGGNVVNTENFSPFQTILGAGCPEINPPYSPACPGGTNGVPGVYCS